jgi:hypothetical protein
MGMLREPHLPSRAALCCLSDSRADILKAGAHTVDDRTTDDSVQHLQDKQVDKPTLNASLSLKLAPRPPPKATFTSWLPTSYHSARATSPQCPNRTRSRAATIDGCGGEPCFLFFSSRAIKACIRMQNRLVICHWMQRPSHPRCQSCQQPECPRAASLFAAFLVRRMRRRLCRCW